MKHITLITLIFISTYCFAVDQKLIDGANKYKVAVESLKKIERNMRLVYGLREDWSKELAEANSNHFESDSMKKIYQDHINENNKQIHNLGIQYEKAKVVIKEYKFIKEEYDRQIEIDRKREDFKTAILNITGMLILPLSIFMFVLWGSIRQQKKIKRLIREGKVNQEKYNQMMQNYETHVFGSRRTNPATGLTMLGGCDSGGNPAGCFFKGSSTFDCSQEYRDQYRWDAYDASRKYMDSHR